MPQPFNLTSDLYHISGVLAFTHECPHGIVGKKMCDVSFDEILDIQLTLYEAMMRKALVRHKPTAYGRATLGAKPFRRALK